MLSTWLVLFLYCSCSSANETEELETLNRLSSKYVFSHAAIGERDLLMFWTPDLALSRVSFALAAYAKGWVGVGWNPDPAGGILLKNLFD
jgi:hypothetical protein